MRKLSELALGLALLTGAGAYAAEPEPSAAPRPVPLTRNEMKQYLEDLKGRTPRIPIPELTDAERQQLGERGQSYEARLRFHYLPQGEGLPGGFGGAGINVNQRPGAPRPDFTRNADPNMTLDYSFKTMLFWIVSRTNNCHYCLGHQEQKLSAAGLTEEQIAALDFDWAKYTPAQQAAFAFARKLTFEPNNITDADIAALREHYTDMQVLEMVLSISGNNSINRWKEGAGIPQSQTGASFFARASADIPKDRPLPNETFLTPTAPEFRDSVTSVAAFVPDAGGSKAPAPAAPRRPGLESRADVERQLAACRARSPRLPLASEDVARESVAANWPQGPLPQWVRLLGNFPVEGKGRLQGLRLAEEQGDLSPLLKAQVSWIVARQDRAWYAAGRARLKMLELGQSEDQVYQLDGSWDSFSPHDRALFNVARKLANTPIMLADADVAEALKQSTPREVVQLINYTTGRAYFDRITEAAGLQLEE